MKKKLAALAVAVGLVLASPTAASAATVSAKDKVGDAPAKFDITRLKVKNSASSVVVVVKVRNLRKRDTQFFSWNVYAAKGTYVGSSHRSKKGKVRNDWYARRSDGILVPTACGVKATWNLKADTVRVKLPRACVAGSGTLKVKASLGSGRANSGKQADVTKKVKVRQG